MPRARLRRGVATASQPDRPDILIERDGSGMVVRVRDGGLAVAGKPSSFVLQQWLTADGDRRSLTDQSLRTEARCDAGGCVIRARDGRFIAYATDRVALIEDCRRADLVVTPIPWTGALRQAKLDRPHGAGPRWRDSAHPHSGRSHGASHIVGTGLRRRAALDAQAGPSAPSQSASTPPDAVADDLAPR